MKKFLWITLVLAVMTIANVKANAKVFDSSFPWGGIVPPINITIDHIDNSPRVQFQKCMTQSQTITLFGSRVSIPKLNCINKNVSSNELKKTLVFNSLFSKMALLEIQRRSDSSDVFHSDYPKIQQATLYIAQHISESWDPDISGRMQEQVGFGYLAKDVALSNMSQVVASLSISVLKSFIQNSSELVSILNHQ